jgi:hypothetical protein
MIMTENNLADVLKGIESQVLENRARVGVFPGDLKNVRRRFDQSSSKMNKAIFNDHLSSDIYHETLQTVTDLVEILLLTRNK